MKIRHRNRIRRPSLAEFSRKWPFGYVTYIYTLPNGKKSFHRHRLMPDVSVTFGGASAPLVAHYTGLES